MQNKNGIFSCIVAQYVYSFKPTETPPAETPTEAEADAPPECFVARIEPIKMQKSKTISLKT